MKNDLLSIKDIMDSIVPISRFNRGEANKIFDELNESEQGCKVVLKNNIPACVLIQPDRYERMVEALEDYALYIEAQKRLQETETQGFLSSEEVMESLGIKKSDLDEVDVEIES